MKKLKDFIYDKNDILIAVLILVVAAAIIAWRMEIILNYPKTLVSNGTTTEEPKNTDASKSDADKTDKNTKADESDAKDDSNTSSNTDNNSQQPAAASLWSANGTLAQDMTVTVEGNTASAAIQCLVDKGLFEDYAEYDSLCIAAGLDDEKVKGGEITFKAGSTKAQIAKQMNWS